MWEIIDKNGTIYSGKEDEIKDIYQKIIYQRVVEGNTEVSWEGDLKLIQVHCIYK
jgi:hypothetical protein